MLGWLVRTSIAKRNAFLAGLALLLAAGGYAARTLPIDAMPDVSTVQVAVLTEADGLSAPEVERGITQPIEMALNGIPHGRELRSTSRGGISAVTVVFDDATDIWFARQLVLERVREVEATLPPAAGKPALGPVSSGLGEIYQFVVRSPQHTPMQLRTLLDWEIVPRLRSVPGVVEVNTMGGELKEFQVVIDPVRLHARKLTLREVTDTLRRANLNVGGGYVNRGAESYTLRGEGILRDEHEIGDVVLRTDAEGTPVLVKHVATVVVGPALRQGVITHGGKTEAVTGIVMMLLGANSRTVVHDVGQRVAEIRRDLPPGVQIETLYDRADFVGRTLDTVLANLLEGVLIVTVVLTLLLGTIRGALAVVLGIPAAMAVALLGMHLFGVTGDLMSLGAIDFGFLVDGPIVVLEAVMAGVAGRKLVAAARAKAYGDVATLVMRPVAFAVAIIALVYVPLLTLEGVEGKMFRPMALTMACALAGALVYAVVFFPAVLVWLVPPPSGHAPRWLVWLTAIYRRLLVGAVAWRWPVLVASVVALVLAGWRFGAAGAEFVPRIFEGDAVVTIRRAPSISLDEAKRLDLATEQVLHRFPEVKSTLGMTGRAEVAIDPVGNDNTDLLVALTPPNTWKTAADFDGLSEAFKRAIEAEVPGTFVSVSQPIEDRTNEMISGSRADVSIQIFGADLEQLAKLADQVGQRVQRVRGAGDVRIERVLGQPTITAKADRARMARYGVQAEDAFGLLQAARAGVPVGLVYDSFRRFDLKVLQPPHAQTVEGLGALYVETGGGRSVPLREVVDLREEEGPTAVRHENRARTVRVDVNLRGRDLVSWVDEAKATVARDVPLPSGYRVEWGGQFENFERAQARLAIVIPVVIGLILGMLLLMFGELRYAGSVFLLVPLSLTGGMLGLLGRGMSFSLPAAVGFIALGGIAVLNGVVLASEVRHRLTEGHGLEQAIIDGSAEVLRAVLTTAAVAALGFLPMAMASSAGAEVQRPLATAVIAGIAFSTLATLFVLPGLLRSMLRSTTPGHVRAQVDAESVVA